MSEPFRIFEFTYSTCSFVERMELLDELPWYGPSFGEEPEAGHGFSFSFTFEGFVVLFFIFLQSFHIHILSFSQHKSRRLAKSRLSCLRARRCKRDELRFNETGKVRGEQNQKTRNFEPKTIVYNDLIFWVARNCSVFNKEHSDWRWGLYFLPKMHVPTLCLRIDLSWG